MNKTFIFASPQLYRKFLFLHSHTSFYYTSQILQFVFFFYKWKASVSPALSASVAIFPTAFAHFVSVAYLSNFCHISDFYYYICYGDL